MRGRPSVSPTAGGDPGVRAEGRARVRGMAFQEADRWLPVLGMSIRRPSVSGFFRTTGLLETTTTLMSVTRTVIMEINKVAQGPKPSREEVNSADVHTHTPATLPGRCQCTGAPRASHVTPTHTPRAGHVTLVHTAPLPPGLAMFCWCTRGPPLQDRPHEASGHSPPPPGHAM